MLVLAGQGLAGMAEPGRGRRAGGDRAGGRRNAGAGRAGGGTAGGLAAAGGDGGTGGGRGGGAVAAGTGRAGPAIRPGAGDSRLTRWCSGAGAVALAVLLGGAAGGLLRGGRSGRRAVGPAGPRRVAGGTGGRCPPGLPATGGAGQPQRGGGRVRTERVREAAPGWVNVAGVGGGGDRSGGHRGVRREPEPDGHAARGEYGWNWDVLLQAEAGYDSFHPVQQLQRLISAEPAVAAWSTFGFSQMLGRRPDHPGGSG